MTVQNNIILVNLVKLIWNNVPKLHLIYNTETSKHESMSAQKLNVFRCVFKCDAYAKKEP